MRTCHDEPMETLRLNNRTNTKKHNIDNNPDIDTDTDTPTTNAITTFEAFEFDPAISRAIADEGYTTPTPIQAQTIESALEGSDVLGCAQTGTGKTAAFALPIIQFLLESGPKHKRGGARLPRALVLAPTRELATQITQSFASYGRHTPLRQTAIFGGVKQSRQERALRDGIDILVATPGRLIDLIDQGIVVLSQIEVLVLDEADRMLDMGFIQPIRRIVKELPEERQTMLFSATMPKEIVKLADSLLTDPVRVSVKPKREEAALIDQTVYAVPRQRKQDLLTHIIETDSIDRAVVFSRTKHGADKITKKLRHAGISAESIHGNKSQPQRERALRAFSSGKSRILVATDVAARGLDVDGITHVFNFDLPMEPEAYVHRIGRTGRAGATGIAIAFCDVAERGLLKAIQRIHRSPMTMVTRLPEMAELPTGADAGPRFFEQTEERTDRPKRRGGGGGGRGRGGGTGGANKPRSRNERSTGARPGDDARPAKPRRKKKSQGPAKSRSSAGGGAAGSGRTSSRNRPGTGAGGASSSHKKVRPARGKRTGQTRRGPR